MEFCTFIHDVITNYEINIKHMAKVHNKKQINGQRLMNKYTQ